MQLPYEREAMNGNAMPEGLCLWQQYIFLSLRILYQQYRAGAINRDTAIAEKRLLEKTARDAESQSASVDKLVLSTKDLWKSIELAGSTYAKNPTIENADAFYKAVYGVGRKHNRLEATP